MVRPDFFMVGAPKCATGTLDSYLSSSPRVFLATKDLHFFAPDLHTTQPPLSEGDYSRLFARAPEGALLGEASVGYMCSGRAATAIHERNPGAAIVMALRNPLQAIPSLHRHCLYYGIEELTDLGAALDAEPARRRGDRLPRRCAHPWMLCYTDVYRYATQIERYYDKFGVDRCHVVLYDDFVADSALTMGALTDFLGVAAVASSYGVRLNHAGRARSRVISAWLTDPPPLLRRVARAAAPQRARRVLADRILQSNTSAAGERVVDSAALDRLAAEFGDELSRLSNLLGRDLRQWAAWRP